MPEYLGHTGRFLPKNSAKDRDQIHGLRSVCPRVSRDPAVIGKHATTKDRKNLEDRDRIIGTSRNRKTGAQRRSNPVDLFNSSMTPEMMGHVNVRPLAPQQIHNSSLHLSGRESSGSGSCAAAFP